MLFISHLSRRPSTNHAVVRACDEWLRERARAREGRAASRGARWTSSSPAATNDLAAYPPPLERQYITAPCEEETAGARPCGTPSETRPFLFLRICPCQDVQTPETPAPMPSPTSGWQKQGGVWILGEGGQDCDTVCAEKGGSCDASAPWPTTEESAIEVAETAGANGPINYGGDWGFAPYWHMDDNR